MPVTTALNPPPSHYRVDTHSRFSPIGRLVALRIALIGSLLLSACDKASNTPTPAGLEQLTFQTLTGQQIPLSDIGGPVLVNFWATDCGICLKEMPDLVELYHQYEPLGFELIAVAMPYDAPNLVLEMSEREQWPFPVALDIKGEALESFASVVGTPTSYLLDKQGRLIQRYQGAIPMQKLENQLNKLLDHS